MSSDVDSARFTNVDWDQWSRRRLRPRGRTLVLVGLLCAWAALLAYDYVVAPDRLVSVGPLRWDLTRMDWLLAFAAVLSLRYAALPLATSRDRAARSLRALVGRPAGALSLAVIAGLTVLALVGPQTFELEYARLTHRMQPPAFVSVPVDTVYNYNCVGRVADGRCHGSLQYPLGTNYIGESVLELLSKGTRVALKLGFAAGVVMCVVATVVGATAGYYGGWVDAVLMRYVDVQQTVPALVVYLVVATLYLGNIQGVSDGGLFALALVFGLLDWGGIARLVRSEALTRRRAGYVRAARAAGASDLRVLRRHVIPNSRATVLTALTRRIPLLVLAQVALAFLELNRAGSVSLGRTMRNGLETTGAPWIWKWWVTTSAVVLLVAMVVAFNVFGDVLRDVLDPQTEVD